MSEDRGDGPRPAGDTPTLLQRLLLGFFAGVLIVTLAFFGLIGIPYSSLWEAILAILGAGCAFGVVLAVAMPWISPEGRFKNYLVFAIAGGVAGGVAWLIARPDTSIVVAAGANALLAFLAPLVEDLFS